MIMTTEKALEICSKTLQWNENLTDEQKEALDVVIAIAQEATKNLR